MSNSIYDSSFLTMRKNNRVISNSFNGRLYPSGQNVLPQNTTSYGPLLGVYDNSIMNNVQMGKQVEYRNNCVINNGCPCNATAQEAPPIPVPVPGWILYAIDTNTIITPSSINDIKIHDNYIYIVGNYRNSINFYNVIGTSIDSSPAVSISDSFPNKDCAFMAKYDLSGTFIWGTNILGELSNTVINSLIIDSNGNLIICGNFNSSVTFNSANLSNPSQPGSPSVDLLFDPIPDTISSFVAKYDNNGQIIWAAPYLSYTSDSSAEKVVVDDSNNIYVVGSIGRRAVEPNSLVNIYDSSLFDPGFLTPVITLTTNYGNAILIKYNSNGLVSWVSTIGNNISAGDGLSIDGTGVYISGVYVSGCVIYKGNNRNLPISTGITMSTDIVNSFSGYIIKFKLSDGDLIYYTKCDSNVGGGGTIPINSIISDKNDKLYCIMSSGSNVDFYNANFSDLSNPIFSTLTINNVGVTDVFIAQYNSISGECIWGTIVSSPITDLYYNIFINNNYLYASVVIRSNSGSIYSANGLAGPSAPVINASFPNNRNSLIIKYDSSGVVQYVTGISDSSVTPALLYPIVYNNYLYGCGLNFNASRLTLYTGNGLSSPTVFGEVTNTARGGIVVRFDDSTGTPS